MQTTTADLIHDAADDAFGDALERLYNVGVIHEPAGDRPAWGFAFAELTDGTRHSVSVRGDAITTEEVA